MILMIRSDGKSVLVNMAHVTLIEPVGTKLCRVWLTTDIYVEVRHSFRTIQKLIAQ